MHEYSKATKHEEHSLQKKKKKQLLIGIWNEMSLITKGMIETWSIFTQTAAYIQSILVHLSNNRSTHSNQNHLIKLRPTNIEIGKALTALLLCSVAKSKSTTWKESIQFCLAKIHETGCNKKTQQRH